jgi:hypothetical protein
MSVGRGRFFNAAWIATVIALGLAPLAHATDIANIQEPTSPNGGLAPAANALPDLRQLRDPFHRVKMEGIENRRKTPLESFPLETLKVVGILTGPSRTRALVKLPEKVKNQDVFVVGEGMRIGQDGAVIQKINADGLVVSGSRLNVIGERELLTTDMPLIPENKNNEAAPVSTAVVEQAFPRGGAPSPSMSAYGSVPPMFPGAKFPLPVQALPRVPAPTK